MIAQSGECRGQAIEPGANLVCCDLTGIDLAGADLSGAGLSYANLTGVKTVGQIALVVVPVNDPCPGWSSGPKGWEGCGLLSGGADLCSPFHGPAGLKALPVPGERPVEARLFCAVLSGISLCQANPTGATVVDADLRFADLRDSVLIDADLTGATLDGAHWGDTICPDGSNSDAADGDGATCLANLARSEPLV